MDNNRPVLIHYLGNADLVLQYPHGNSKGSGKDFYRTKPSNLKKIKKAVEFQDAHVVYKDNQTIARNLKQCQNVKHYVNNEKRITYDEIYNCHLIHNELNVIKLITTAPYLIVIAVDDLLLREIKTMVEVSHENVLFSYDTTFNVGDFFVSPLLCRHSMFKSEAPIPVAFLYHDSKCEEVHLQLFNFIEKVLVIDCS